MTYRLSIGLGEQHLSAVQYHIKDDPRSVLTNHTLILYRESAKAIREELREIDSMLGGLIEEVRWINISKE